jgi:two-component system, NtrC family, response regulator HydG
MTKRILLVDDSPESLLLSARYFKRHGFEVTVALCGIEAIELLRDNVFHVIVSDVLMPDGSGVDILREMHIERNNTPIVLISADARAKEQAKALGADAFIQKPLDMDQLHELVERLIREAPSRPPMGLGNKKPTTEIVGGENQSI